MRFDAIAEADWMDSALCAQIDTDVFFPEGPGAASGPAKAICRRCPVIAECLSYALAYESGEHGTQTSYPAGIYGGLSPRERAQILGLAGSKTVLCGECGAAFSTGRGGNNAKFCGSECRRAARRRSHWVSYKGQRAS